MNTGKLEDIINRAFEDMKNVSDKSKPIPTYWLPWPGKTNALIYNPPFFVYIKNKYSIYYKLANYSLIH